MKVIALIALAVAAMPVDTPEVHAYRVAITPAGEGATAIANQDVPLPADGSPSVQAEFDDVPPGDWSVHATAVDAGGNAFGPVQSAPFTVPAPDVQRALPVSITVTLS